MEYIFATIFGLPLGIGVTLFIMATALDKSNNFGDNKASLINFSKHGIQGLNSQNRIRKNTPLDPVCNPEILRHDKLENNSDSIMTDTSLDEEIDSMDLSNMKSPFVPKSDQ